MEKNEHNLEMHGFMIAVAKGEVPGYEDHAEDARGMLASGEVEARWPTRYLGDE